MGFRVPRTNELLIEWAEDHPYHGASIRLSMDLPMKLLFRFQRSRRTDGEAMTPEQQAEQEELMHEFGDAALIEWNLEDENGEPLPANGDGFLTQSFGFASEVFKKWAETVQATDATDGPLASNSENGHSAKQSVPISAMTEA